MRCRIRPLTPTPTPSPLALALTLMLLTCSLAIPIAIPRPTRSSRCDNDISLALSGAHVRKSQMDDVAPAGNVACSPAECVLGKG
ncbi:hypothetical protein HanIR_Chr17g0845891 [Helianthus annuus]|nr:hypothetical protein HanIR_Chr17g0845891 [Helianthus annuus]